MTQNTEDTQKVLNVQPFKLISSAQRNVIERFYEEVSGLHRGQFASNSWGFPNIPIPNVRFVAERTRLAPTNVSNDFLGHPIYWIDPQLTYFNRKTESEEEWSIRMFYLIMGFGYWTESLQWIDVLESKGIEHSEADVQVYHISSNPECVFDQVEFLKEGDLLIEEEEILDSYRSAIGRCSSELDKEMDSFLRRQMTALGNAKALLGGEAYNPNLEADDPQGFWSQNLEPNLRHLCELYDSQFNAQHQQFGKLVEPSLSQFRGLIDVMMGMNKIIATLTVPVIRKAETLSEAYSHMTTYMAVANKQATDREKGYPLLNYVNEALGAGRAPKALHGVLQEGYSQYRSCWRRLRMAVANYERMQKDLPPFENYSELEVALVQEESQRTGRVNQEQSDNLEEIDRIFGGGN